MITQIVNIFNLPIDAICEKSWIFFALEKCVKSKMAMLQLTEYALSLLMKISLTVNATIKLLYKSWNKFFNSRIYDRKS